jgi:murein DD-endopeptidase MepM/ murein hydrolase activator NlpD
VISRRLFVSSALALSAAPRVALAEHLLSFTGSLQQGSLVIGKSALDAVVRVDGKPVSLTKDGSFAFGLEYDQKTATTVVARFSDAETESRIITPVVRHYEVQEVNGLPEKTVAPSPDEIARIKRENAMVAEVRKADSAGVGFAEPFDWPVPGIISSLFGSQRKLNGELEAPHFGVDIAAPANTLIHAPADGTVVLAQPDFFLTGGTTLLDHGHGVFTVYLHQNTLKVAVGQAVKRGDVLGLVGMKGRATGPHLHWGLNWFQMRLDPSLSARTPTPPKA